MNEFLLLNLPEALDLDLEKLKSNYQELASQHHPDAGGEEDLFKQLNQAYEKLVHPHSRAICLLSVKKIQYESRGSISENIMNCFMPLSELLQETDSHIKDVKLASSVLQKALLSAKSLTIQGNVEQWIENLDSKQQAIEQQIKELSLTGSEIQTFIRDLAFIFKWKAQLRARFAELFI